MTTEDTTTITEGSTRMIFSKQEESTVFYNPVQVQNRDLSILMICLANERRAVRRAVHERKVQLKQEGKNSAKASNNSNATEKTVPSLQEQLDTYEKSLNPSQLVEELDASTQGMTVLDALAASGLRSIRYWKEIPNLRHVTINDMDAAAIDRARQNVKDNNLQDRMVDSSSSRPYGISLQQGDATQELYASRRPQRLVASIPNNNMKPRWDIIDLDPYGSAAPFLDGAIQAIEHEGMLCVTCTDMAALGGSHPETCFGRYGSMPIQTAGYLQEMALRILLSCMATIAARYGRTIQPILSVGMNFYVRVFVQINDNKAQVNDLSLQLGNVYQSTKCSSFVVVPIGQMGGKKQNVYQNARLPCPLQCPETGGPMKKAGPIWLGPLHDQNVVKTALERLESKETAVPDMLNIATKDRLIGLLTSCYEELNEVPLYYKLSDMSRTLGISVPKQSLIKSALVNAGYRVSGYHKEPQALKTDAPDRVVWDVFRAHAKKHPPAKRPTEGSAAADIMAKEPTFEVDWTLRNEVESKSSVPRFPNNPERNWGPKKAASGYKRKAENEPEKE